MRIIGTARTDQNDAEFRAHALAAIRDHVSASLFDEARVATFLEQIHYVPLDATDILGFHRLAKVAGDTSGVVAIFLSTAPSLFKATIDGVRAAWLAAGMTPRPYASGN